MSIATATGVESVRVRRDSGIYGYERALARSGLSPVAGADEAGRGACAGPLVAAATILSDTRTISGLRDSKLMTPAARERAFNEIKRQAIAWAIVSIEADECDRLGMHVANVEALRRAVLRLDQRPRYVLTDGFGVDGMAVPGLAVWKGDQVAACVAAASVLAKVTRDRIMVKAEEQFPGYDFAAHKGYCTAEHQQRLEALGPSSLHRMRFDNVRRSMKPDRLRLPPRSAVGPNYESE